MTLELFYLSHQAQDTVLKITENKLAAFVVPGSENAISIRSVLGEIGDLALHDELLALGFSNWFSSMYTRQDYVKVDWGLIERMNASGLGAALRVTLQVDPICDDLVVYDIPYIKETTKRFWMNLHDKEHQEFAIENGLPVLDDYGDKATVFDHDDELLFKIQLVFPDTSLKQIILSNSSLFHSEIVQNENIPMSVSCLMWEKICD